MNYKKLIGVQKIIFALTIMTSTLAVAAGGAHGAGHDEIPFEAIRNQAINLGILLAVLLYFITTPLKNSFKAKKELFLDEAAKTEAALKLAEAELAEIKSKLAALEQGEKSAVLNAEKEAQSHAEKIVLDAQTQGQKIIEDTNLIIAAEVVNAKNAIREKIINKSLNAAENNIKASSDAITKKSETGFLQDLGQVKA
ncbi:MAG: ATP synthase F0 subunit B [Pseudobdellovibrio sp.]